MNQATMQDKEKRLQQANALLETISRHGRRFFQHEGRVAKLELDKRSRVWLIDAYSQRRIYTHHPGRWRGFTGGGTLRSLIEQLRTYITWGTPLPGRALGPWPEWICGGDLWGYGEEMQAVRLAASALGLIEPEPPHIRKTAERPHAVRLVQELAGVSLEAAREAVRSVGKDNPVLAAGYALNQGSPVPVTGDRHAWNLRQAEAWERQWLEENGSLESGLGTAANDSEGPST